jgi:hypothetical protein
MIVVILPAKWSFFAIGFAGLYARLSARRGALIWLPGAVAIIALLALLVGELYWTWASQIGVYQTGSTAVVDLAATSAVNQQVDYRIARKAAVPLGHADVRACAGFSQKPVALAVL